MSRVGMSFNSNIKEVTKGLTHLQKKQIPFAASQALNDTAFHLTMYYKKKSNQVFEGGATRYTQAGFRYDKSKKTDLTATVYVNEDTKGTSNRAEYMEKQIDGGVRLPNKDAIVVPNKRNYTEATYPSGNITKGQMNKLFRDKKKYFFGIPKGGQGTEGIWERYGREASGTSAGERIRQVARLTKSARYKALFGFVDFGDRIAFNRKTGFESNFAKRLRNALKTAR